MTTSEIATDHVRNDVRSALARLLSGELAFPGKPTNQFTHGIHPFAAKFPPQLPRAFIEKLTRPGETVLDPMVGSGTALVEAANLHRLPVGFDLDPLALRITSVKTRIVSEDTASGFADAIADRAATAIANPGLFQLHGYFETAYSDSARDFFRYWFRWLTICELTALSQAISRVPPPNLRPLYEVILSSTIVAKSAGVSLARDLAHSRPHRVSSKKIPSAIDLFRTRANKVIPAVANLPPHAYVSLVANADSRALPLRDDVVDLVVTSPPYANAIDYMRAHKFSLMWLGNTPDSLTARRRQYIGAEIPDDKAPLTARLGLDTIQSIRKSDPRRAAIVHKYFADMKLSIAEMFRVLKPGRAAAIVVGSSTVRGINVPTPFVLAREAESLGFIVVDVAQRPIDRDKRMMPISRNGNGTGIEARMHQEHVLGLFKPDLRTSDQPQPS